MTARLKAFLAALAFSLLQNTNARIYVGTIVDGGGDDDMKITIQTNDRKLHTAYCTTTCGD